MNVDALTGNVIGLTDEASATKKEGRRRGWLVGEGAGEGVKEKPSRRHEHHARCSST
jgi:hypothetical protein